MGQRRGGGPCCLPGDQHVGGGWEGPVLPCRVLNLEASASETSF